MFVLWHATSVIEITCTLTIQEMTLEEYEKVLEEKRKAILALKAEERKVEVDKELQSMQQLSVKKDADEVFIKLVSYKSGGLSSVCGHIILMLIFTQPPGVGL